MTTKPTLETDYVRSLMQRTSLELRDVRLFRRNVGVVKLEDRVFRASLPGQCDVWIVGRGGWYGELEIKRFGVLSSSQLHWRDWCAEWGVPWNCLAARREESMSQTVDRWMKEIRLWLPDRLGS